MARGIRTNGINTASSSERTIPEVAEMQRKMATYPSHEHLRPIGLYPVPDPVLGIAFGIMLETDLTDREMNASPMFENLHEYLQRLRAVAEPDGFVGCSITGLGGKINV